MAAAVDPRLGRSLSMLSVTDDSSAAQRERFFRESTLPTSMGGINVGGQVERCAPAYASGMLTRLEAVIATCPFLHGMTPHRALELPSYAEAVAANDVLRGKRPTIRATAATPSPASAAAPRCLPGHRCYSPH